MWDTEPSTAQREPAGVDRHPAGSAMKEGEVSSKDDCERLQAAIGAALDHVFETWEGAAVGRWVVAVETVGRRPGDVKLWCVGHKRITPWDAQGLGEAIKRHAGACTVLESGIGT